MEDDEPPAPLQRAPNLREIIKLRDQAEKMVGERIGLTRTESLRQGLANAKGEPAHGETMATGALFTLPDEKFIRQLDKAFHPEFKFLAEATGTTVERGTNHGLGQFGPEKNKLPSELLFANGPHAEVDRTIVGILCMKWIMIGDYESFTAHQNPAIKFKRDEFDVLREFFILTFGNSSNSYMLIVSMILNDLGKNDRLKTDIKEQIERNGNPNHLHHPAEPLYPPTAHGYADKFLQEEKTLNHDEVIYYAAKLNVLELITEFDGERRLQLELGIQFGSLLNIGQLAQAECVPGSLQAVSNLMQGHVQAFNFKFLEVVLDVAGAQGHVDSRCSLSWISPVYQGYENARLRVQEVIDGTHTSREAYDKILAHRAKLLHDKGWPKLLTTNTDRDRAVLRLITMARAASPRDAQKVEDALESLPTCRTNPPIRDFFNRPVDNMKQALINGLNVDGITDGLAIIPYYAPGLLAEIMRVTKARDEVEQREAIAAFLRLMARAFVGTRPQPDLKAGLVIECDLSFTQGTIRDPAFETNPRMLDALDRPETDPYNKDVEALMKGFYGIRPLSRRSTPKTSTT